MNESVKNFLNQKRVAVLAVQINRDIPHAATVHYSHSNDPIEFFFLTDKKYRKCQKLNNTEAVSASVVVGFSEDEMITVQFDGLASIITDEEGKERFKEIYFSKHPDAKKYLDDPDTVLLKFVPTWGRYTNYNTDPETKILLKSFKL